MTPRCCSEPISYLRLERHLQRDLGLLERLRVSWHLQRCAVCRDCFAGVRGDVVALRPLPRALLAPARPRLARVAPPLLWAATAAGAALLLWQTPRPEPLPSRPARVAIKGGELALELVREDRGQLARDATRYAAGDRFQARISCPPDGRWHWQLLVRQADETYFPLAPGEPFECANHLTLPGAFTLDGDTQTRVCVVLSRDPLSPEQLERSALPNESACVELVPSAPSAPK